MFNVRYTYSADEVSAEQLAGLRTEWVNPPSPATTLAGLSAMNAAVLALDEAGQVVGFACGLTDGVLMLYVWDVEVLSAWRGQGLERELLSRLVERFGQVYQVNAHPSAELRPLFEGLGFAAYRPEQALAMTRMRMDWQDGGPNRRD